MFLNGDFQKALESYTKALMLKPGDKGCLVARSKCYIHIGDPESALKDADECIKDDKTYHKGIYQRAEALYQMGNFEHGLIFFHRGHALRPELDQFRRGIQKCQEAIENSVGGKRQSEYNIYTLKNLNSQSRDSKKSFRRTFGKSPIVQGINKLKLN